MMLDDYVGIPYVSEGRSRAGVDCYGLVELVYQERLGIVLPEFMGYGDPLSDAAATMIDEGREDWVKVSLPSLYDCVLFRVGGRPAHIGIVIRPGWMLHSARGKDACFEDYRRPLWRSRIEGFYHYAR